MIAKGVPAQPRDVPLEIRRGALRGLVIDLPRQKLRKEPVGVIVQPRSPHPLRVLQPIQPGQGSLIVEDDGHE